MFVVCLERSYGFHIPECFFKEILGVTITDAEILEELPQETVSVKRTDYPVLVKDIKGKEEIYLVEFQTE
ncbi:MAG: hypothetical protein L6Q54_08650 [Leptospiraceae bacterium]|nr:hypothetical protein [Leptospiraceae bacterium]MCK6381303.1 hypothetical protein [Leptospiraceae bacterium]